MSLLHTATAQFFRSGYRPRYGRKLAVFTYGSVRQLSSKPSEQHIIRSKHPDISIPTDVSLSQLIVSRAQQFTDRIAMIDSVSGSEHTYADLLTNMERVASALRRRGLQKNDVLCIYAGNSIEFVYMMMGTIHAGGIVTTVNPTYTAGEVLYQLEDSQPKFIACSAAISQVAAQACDQYANIQERFSFGDAEGFTNFSVLLEEDATSFEPETISLHEDITLLPYSSGTTGRVKGVMLSHYNMVANLYQFNTALSEVDRPCGTAETYLNVLPLFHLYGIYASTLYSLFKGNTFVIMAGFDPTAYLQCVQDHKVTLLHIVPPMGLVLCRHPQLSSFDLSSVHTVMSAAAPMGKELEEEIQRSFKVNIVKQGYGLTETSPIVTMSPPAGTQHGSVGLVVANTECMLVDEESGESLPANTPGELWVRGPQVMKGYLNKPNATAETVDADGWLHTGDVAYYDDRENFYIVDRLKELIKYKGFQVAPAELEAVLITHPAIADAAVIGVPHEAAGEVPRAFVVRKKEATVTEDEIMDFVKEQLAPYKQLRGGVEFREAIPKSPSGKILRRFLRDEVIKS